MTQTKRKLQGKGLAIIISLAVLAGIYTLMRVTGMLNWYRIPTSSCAPRYEVDSRVFVSNLKNFHRGDFVSYRGTHTTYFRSDEVFMSQVIALEGETLVVKGNIAYVNGKLVDDTMQLKFTWYRDDLQQMDYMQELANHPEREPNARGNRIIEHLTISEAQQMHLEKCEDLPAGTGFAADQGWRHNQFGPFVVPKGFVFLMSPNRDNALDSRYRGPVPMEDVTGVILN